MHGQNHIKNVGYCKNLWHNKILLKKRFTERYDGGTTFFRPKKQEYHTPNMTLKFDRDVR